MHTQVANSSRCHQRRVVELLTAACITALLTASFNRNSGLEANHAAHLPRDASPTVFRGSLLTSEPRDENVQPAGIPAASHSPLVDHTGHLEASADAAASVSESAVPSVASSASPSTVPSPSPAEAVAPASKTAPPAEALRALLQLQGAADLAGSLAAREFLHHCPLNHADYQYNATLFHPIVRRSLAAWRAGGLTHRAIETAWNVRTGNVHIPLWYSVKGGTVYQRIHPSVGGEPPFNGHIKDMIQAAAQLQPQPPDSELVVNPWDHPKVPFQDTIPVFTWVTTPAHSDIMFPGPMPWTQGISEPGPEHMKQAPADGRPLPGAPPSVTPHPGPASASASGAADTASAAQSPDFDPSDPRWPRWSPQDIYRCDKKLADRKPAAFWRGGLTGPTVGYKGGVMKHYQRVRAGLLSSEHPTLIDASLTGVDGLEAEFPDETSHFLWPHARDTSNGGECEHRYNLNIAGNTAIARTARLFVRGVVIWPSHPFEEFWHSAFEPWVDYIPAAADLSDLPAIVTWLNEHPDVAERVHANGAAKARRITRRETWICYWWHLLHEYGALFPKDFVAEAVKG